MPNTEKAYHGIVIAEGLEEPRLINDLRVYRAEISQEGAPIDHDGTLGRWHLYWIEANDETIGRIQEQMKHGWYSHFWRGDQLLVVFNDARFDVRRWDPSSWTAPIEHGEQQGIPRDELDFPSRE
jgi:hypothetical protein